MKTVLKIGDNIYGQSIQEMTDSYFSGFPQREYYLNKYIKGWINVDFFRNSVLKNLEEIIISRSRLKEYLSRRNYDYIMIDNPLSYLSVDNSINIPILFDCIDWYDEMYLKEFGVDRGYYLLRYAYLSLLERSQKVIAQSPIILNHLIKWGLKTSKTTVIPNGYDPDFFYPHTTSQIQKNRSKISKKYNISFNGKKIIVYTGKLNRWYENIKIIIAAIEDDQILLIVGDGPLYKSLPSKPNIIKCGPVNISDVAVYTNIADVLVFPVDDCSPIAISEYLAVGKPIVALKGRISWLLEHGKSGYLVDNNIASWQDGIRKALVNRKIISTYNLSLSKRLSWKKLSEEFINFIEK
jgi:glycosyltransferase involved in cell wall biosynthesis